ncbi:Fe-S cluster assembly protein SufD [Candidatus Woesearchaeota archaeon]|nr:Fe-S cluster assembly protein SufD [Candidatus Woesearchaeota archaeon]
MNRLSEITPSMEFIEKLAEEWQEPSWLIKKRKEAYNKYCELLKPQMKYGTTILFSLHNLDLDTLQLNPAIQSLTITNNHNNSNNNNNNNNDDNNETSDESNDNHIVALDLHQALQDEKYQAMIKQYLFKSINLSTDHHNYLEHDETKWFKFNCFHTSFFMRGAFVFIPKNIVVEQPIYLDFSTLNKTQLDHTLIIAEEGSAATIIFTNRVPNNEELFRTNYVEVIVKENASIKIVKTQNYAKHIYSFEQNNAVIGNDATINWYIGTFGSGYVKADTRTELAGNGSVCNIHGLFLASKQQQFDLNTAIVHKGNHTHSEIFARGAVKEKAKALYRGLVDIKEHAFQSKGNQKEDILILNKGAEADAIPKLLIAQNDVKCNHGASIGQVDQEKLFYLMSRGIAEEKAKHMIVEGFFSQVLDHFPQQSIIDEMKEIIHQQIVQEAH